MHITIIYLRGRLESFRAITEFDYYKLMSGLKTVNILTNICLKINSMSLPLVACIGQIFLNQFIS